MALATGEITLVKRVTELYRGAEDPEAPEDGQLVYNTTENVLKQWDAAAAEGAGAYTVIADYNTMSAQLGAVEDVTTGNTDFLGLLASAEYTVDGLLLKGVGGTFSLLLGPSRIGFYQSCAEVAYITGNKLYITSAELIAELKIGNYIITSTADGGLAFK